MYIKNIEKKDYYLFDGTTIIVLPNGITMHIENARCNEYHLEILVENTKECFCITFYEMNKIIINENF